MSTTITGATSDGYHSFDELYDHRMSLTSALTQHVGGIKSKLHSDGDMFKDYFIIVFQLNGNQCSYHYHMDNWDCFDHLREVERAPEWNGHTANDVAQYAKAYRK